MNCLVLVFSRNRAMQLDATLRSFLLHCQDISTCQIRVLYTTTDTRHTEQYQCLKQDYAEYPTIQFVREQDFRSDVLALLALFDHVLFLVDDNIFIRNFILHEGISVLSMKSKVLGVSLRLGRNTTYCYPLDSPQTLPSFSNISPGNSELLGFRWVDAQHDFSYPLEVSSSLYRTDDLYDLMSTLSFSNPNALEGQLAEQKEQFILSTPDLACYGHSVTFCNPLNMVQTVCLNRAATDPQVTSEGLAEKFQLGHRVDVESYVNFTPQSAHQEVDLHLTSVLHGSSDVQRSTSPVVVSVVIPCFNQGEFLSEAVGSVVEQSYQDWEIIIVDDGSSDSTAHVAEQLKKEFSDKNIHLLQQVNQGLASARNSGIRMAKGRYILPLDADDCLHSEMLGKTVRLLEEDPSTAIAYTDTVTFGLREEVWLTGGLVLEEECERNCICYCSLFRRDMWAVVGGYNPNMIWGYEDWDFWISCLEKGYSGKRVPEALFRYRLREGTMYSRALQHDVKLKAQIVANHLQLYNEATQEWAVDLLNQHGRSQASMSQELTEKAGTLSLTPQTQVSTYPMHSNSKESFGSDEALPLVSVIVPTYNRAERLRETLTSILGQTYVQYEVIVVNDGGEDVGDLVASFNDKNNVHYVRHASNRGLAAARNSGLGVARGKYIAYLDDDDRFLPKHLEVLVSFLEQSQSQIAYTDAWRIVQSKEEGEYTETGRSVPYSHDFDPDKLLITNYFPVLCLMHEKVCLEKTGGFDEILTTHEDWDLWIRLSRHFAFVHLKEVTAEFTWRIDGSSMTSRISEDFLRTQKMIYKKYDEYFCIQPHLIPARDQAVRDLEAREKSHHIVCSIIIPVFNKKELTEQCLLNLVQVTTEICYEVVIVDNHSTDGTSEFLAMLGGDVHIIRNAENRGFAKACNQGGRVARGKYLVFLNNDTIPQVGWLEALLEEVNTHADVAVVGSKLLFPDNTIQHAGIVFNRTKGLPYQWGRGHTSSPMFNHRREFQAVTAACMLVRRESFESVDGFDERYVNGYEDVDLCLKIKERGEKVIYQPKSCLYHLEGKSEGRQDRMSENTEYFLSRWGKVWLEDEDIVFDEERNFMTLHAQQNDGAFLLGDMGKNTEHSQRQVVVEVQKQLLGHVKGPFPQNASMVALAQKLAEYERWPSDSGVLTWGGAVCHSLGLYDHGLGFIQRALKLADEPLIRLLYAQVAIKAGRLVEAQEQLTSLKRSNSFGKDACLAQGVLFLQLNDYVEAKAIFQLVLAEDSTHIKARLGLGMAEMGEGNGASAFNSFQAVLSQCPDHREAIDLLLQAGTQLNDWVKLCSELEKFHNRNPSDCDIRFALASVYLRMGLVEKAKSHYETLQLCAKDYVGLDDLAASLSRCSIIDCRSEEQQSADDQKLQDTQRQDKMKGPGKEKLEREQLGQKAASCSFESSETSRLLVNSSPVGVSNAIYPVKDRVSVIANDVYGAGVRLYSPLRSLMEKEQLIGRMFLEVDMNENTGELPIGANETLVVQRIAKHIEPRLKAMKSQGIRIVHDFDDLLWKLPQENINYQIITSSMLDSFFRIMGEADCVTVSTEPLQEALDALNIKSMVLPNCLFGEHWSDLKPHRRTGRRPRVGWAGQVGVHQEDVAILLPLIEMLGQEVEWVFLGEIPKVQSGVRFEAETYGMVSAQDFPAKLASLNLDLALAPLALNEFNEAKSDLRVLQYGILGYPVVGTDIFPYQSAPLTRVPNDPTSWARAIRDHINNPDASAAQGEKLRQWVLSHRMFDQWASRYQEAWLGEPSKQVGMFESECIPRVSLPEFELDNAGGKVAYICSIIIPVFNKVDLTCQCLTHLAKVTDGCSYEVIIVDNASTDGTGPFLSSLEGDIQIITNESNLGFAKACNQGAKAANGKYLVFLNNDTIPQEGWLSPLVEEVERNADVAVVGSKLIFPDHTIQHAGVVFPRKVFMPYHIFNGAAENFPAVNVRREFQAVTAACMLVKRESFEAVGGFDEGFINGFEDVDFCLKIREGGERVVYQPKSILFHLAQQTPGRKNKDNEEKNCRRLRERWEGKVTPDEDMYYVSEGYKRRIYVENGILRVTVTPFVDEREKTQWHNLEHVQRLLLQNQYTKENGSSSEYEAKLRPLLSHASEWPKDVEALRWAAFICHKHEFHENEKDFWNQILELEDDAEARGYFVSSALKQNNFSDARQHLQTLLVSHPKHGNGHFLQGVLFLRLTQYVPASESFRLAVELGFDHLKAEKGLGMAYLGMGNADESWRVYDKVLAYCPDDVEVINGLLQAGTALERWEELANILSHYLERNPQNLDICFALASVAYRAGQLGQAKQQLAFLKLMKPAYDGLFDLERLLSQTPSVNSVEAILTNYRCDETTKVWRRSGYPGIAYSDGDEIEGRLKRIVETSSDVSVMSTELASHCCDWATHYHLSRQRANLLRPFESQLQGKLILEIGAGCGAITRYLGEIGAEVLALEGSPRRASIAALRCREQANVTVVAEAIHEFQRVPQFDVVTLIGVLEYARKFFPGEGRDPVDAMLKYVTGFLKPGGRLIIAIENQLGLKYFAGFPEDHMGQPMFGIEEHYDVSNVVTFGRKDLGDRVREAGLTESQWWYPFPDYKLPSLMVSEQGAVPTDDMDLFSLVRHACSEDRQYPSSVSFNQGRAWRPIMRNGLLREMSNSFVFVASDTEIPVLPDKPLALHYATNRRSEFAKKVLFSRTQDGEAMTHQIALYPQAVPDKNSMVKLRLEQAAFIQGQLWQDRLVDIMTTPGWTVDHIQQWFQVWLKAFYSAAGLQSHTHVMYEKIPGTYVDMTPRNLIIDHDGIGKFFDQEWEYLEAIQVGLVVFRALLTSIGYMKNVCSPLEQSISPSLQLVMKIAENAGFSFSTQDLKEYMAFERAFQKCIEGRERLHDTGLHSSQENERGVVQPKESPATHPSAPSEFDCSIIIPVCNRIDLTSQCLTHLAQVTHGCSYEVVVVDNGSTDETKEFLASLGGDIRIITNESNLGFAKACNQGAYVAQGQFLVFLNNDTIPKSGWLAPLVGEVRSHDDVSIVGSKLLYPDNTIQHAGVVFDRNFQNPYHLFGGVSENCPGVNIRRAFQAVTAACMLVRREVFEEVGGFDEGFVNGFEDVDLCLKIRQLGKKIIYQPQSCLYHLESQTPGRKKYNETNLKRFLDRWGNQWLNDEDLVTYQNGYIHQYCFENENIEAKLIPTHKVIDLVRWKRTGDLQQLLLGQKFQPLEKMVDNHKICELLADVESWPSDISILDWVGRVCDTLQCESLAIQYWEKSLTLGDHQKARLGLARVHLKNGNTQAAQNHLGVLIRKFTPDAEGWLLQGILSIQQNKYSEAKWACAQSFALDSGNINARLGLGMACMGLAQTTEAWNTFQQVVAIDPDHAEAIRSLIQAGTALKRWHALAEHLSRFVERNPTDCDIRFALAGVLFRAGSPDKAKEHLTCLRLVKPDYEGIEDLERVLVTPQSESNLVSVR